MIQKKWFRIETDSSGAILSCEEVSSKGRQGAIVRYYEALTKAEACKAAKEWAERHRSKYRQYNHRRYAERKQAGLCATCGKEPSSVGQSCRKCADRYNERKRARKAGEPLLRTPRLPTEDVHERINRYARDKAKRDQAKWGSHRSKIAFDNLRDLDRLGPVAFRMRLCDRIRKAGGGAALDEYERERAKSNSHDEAAE